MRTPIGPTCPISSIFLLSFAQNIRVFRQHQHPISLDAPLAVNIGVINPTIRADETQTMFYDQQAGADRNTDLLSRKTSSTRRAPSEHDQQPVSPARWV